MARGADEAARRAVVVTGASSGIGAGAAAHLVRRGFRVFGTVRREEDRVELERAGAEAVLMDLADEGAVARGCEEVLGRIGGGALAGLVNNAGVGAVGPLEELEIDEIRAVFDVNLFGALAVTKALLPALRASRGRIVMISSVSGRIASPFIAAYAASKFALEAASDSLRRELLPHGVQVVVVQPGPIATPIWDKMRVAAGGRFAASPYRRGLQAFGREASRAEGAALPVERTSRAIERALTSRRPPTRIVVTRRPLLIRLVSALPDRVVDRLVAARTRR